MIKKYNQFVETKVNEEYADPQTAPAPTAPSREVETMPGTRPGTRPMPTRPSVVPGKRPSEEDAPLANFDMEEDEQEDTYTSKLVTLALALGLSKNDVIENKIQFEGKTIIFPSETEKYHVDRKKFDTVEQVVAYLTGDVKRPILDDETVDPEFEAKSYRFSRRDRLK